MKLHLIHHYPSDPPWWAREISNKLELLMAKLDDIISKVNDLSSVEDSVITLLDNISQQLKDAGQDAAKLDALSKSIDDQKAKLAAAVAANTPAAPDAPQA